MLNEGNSLILLTLLLIVMCVSPIAAGILAIILGRYMGFPD